MTQNFRGMEATINMFGTIIKDQYQPPKAVLLGDLRVLRGDLKKVNLKDIYNFPFMRVCKYLNQIWYIQSFLDKPVHNIEPVKAPPLLVPSGEMFNICVSRNSKNALPGSVLRFLCKAFSKLSFHYEKQFFLNDSLKIQIMCKLFPYEKSEYSQSTFIDSFLFRFDLFLLLFSLLSGFLYSKPFRNNYHCITVGEVSKYGEIRTRETSVFGDFSRIVFFVEMQLGKGTLESDLWRRPETTLE